MRNLKKKKNKKKKNKNKTRLKKESSILIRVIRNNKNPRKERREIERERERERERTQFLVGKIWIKLKKCIKFIENKIGSGRVKTKERRRKYNDKIERRGEIK